VEKRTGIGNFFIEPRPWKRRKLEKREAGKQGRLEDWKIGKAVPSGQINAFGGRDCNHGDPSILEIPV
jgi:hypothetical protein